MRTFSPRDNKGFSLVELMVVVAIIGILASIAIPSLQKYMAKARQSEAKTSLASLYTAEKAFFAEFNVYTGDWKALGYQPEGQLRYKTGFSGLGLPLAPYGYNQPPGTVYETTGSCDAPGTPNASRTKNCIMTAESLSGVIAATGPDGSAAQPANITPSTGGFVAAASSLIYTAKSNAIVDTWIIDENKNISQISNGIPQ